MDIERNDEEENELKISKPPGSEPEKKKDKALTEPHFTEVENAHASGLGSMGRSDEKVKDKEKGAGEGEAVY
ncbi:hypothetical protein OCK74_19175 [Chitinophagaceae bacterium LB-8]|uniref:Uncharacterized protein n=1 Tax=Paraflavisolibacter caeni TaxID=2982496 RepID=A0A9X2XYZ7_9BACT|nr:hypothetical protein [Paraflavisolibacter caeni]MCU7551252.1 hypothetical protein [Paraflavisolibacter caeni]